MLYAPCSTRSDPPRKHQEEEHQLDDAIESLQAAFTEQGTQSKKQIAEILVGTHKHVRSMINLMDDNVDPYYGNGISLVKKGTTGIERTTYAREIEIKEIYDATQVWYKYMRLANRTDHRISERLKASLMNSKESMTCVIDCGENWRPQSTR